MINKNTIAITAAAATIAIAAGVAVKKKFFAGSKITVETLEKFDSFASDDHDANEIISNTYFEMIGKEMKESGVPVEQAMNFASEVDAVLKFWREHRNEGAKLMYSKKKIGGETILAIFGVVHVGHPNRNATVEYKAI